MNEVRSVDRSALVPEGHYLLGNEFEPKDLRGQRARVVHVQKDDFFRPGKKIWEVRVVVVYRYDASEDDDLDGEDDDQEGVSVDRWQVDWWDGKPLNPHR